ncbi:Lrp/AsnC family transcriptional regulator [Cobetia marina]|jgi:Lrp/AsnC family transcriptional regulator of ectoine degradation|uniref:Lrp/AsnC family transcriptional regulator n=1 Tax=Cobetia marina TaxID=28258 RepID=A0ABU9GIB3_COBMA|nr:MULTISPECIES: Lrp/AsnC family transcriptional regulator [Cobetia]MDA5564716.1 Lrp/AsnC family transcriptional regulator [Cobetia sp. MMG027]MDH2292644.1 Lrp/AsnC family transcriptional regulator [Cobetia sp. 10Alg 146]MDH2372804.1 Lrp/AsnC family transcriptional regulator [Cobetia sp. 3AK]MDI6002971.1 Lrp/AsnC family transcriptional regulator [Cobetia pacifica]MDN2657599.1 Lrp/AsnC family transcriptional regulator [Cobetia sp. 14N.309.X.WAT.E.A4]
MSSGAARAMPAPRLDAFDLKILAILERDGRITKSRLAEEINLSVSPCWERVKRLEQAGIIEGYSARINQALLEAQRGGAVVAAPRTPVWVEIHLKHHDAESFQRFERAMREADEVIECVAVGGGVDYLLRLETASIDAYQRLIDRWLVSELGIDRYFTYIVTKQVK